MCGSLGCLGVLAVDAPAEAGRRSGQARIVFFKSRNCPNCPRVYQLLVKLLREKGLDESVVEVRDISDPDAKTDLLMLGVLSVPCVVVGGKVLVNPSEDALRRALEAL